MPTSWLKAIVLSLTGLIVVASPPEVAFMPVPALGWVAFAACLGLTFWAGSSWPARGAQALGEVGAWLVILWCVLSQPDSLLLTPALVQSMRLLTIALALVPWAWLRLTARWQRRTMLALVLPAVLTLGALIATSPSRPLVFRPHYVAAAADGTVYITDHESPVIRVFRPDGTLVGKLRPGLASVQGPPGPGMSAIGPYNDPERLGIARATGPQLGEVGLRPWPIGLDDFWFSGLAVDSAGNLVVPDWMHHRLLRFEPGGHLMSAAPLPAGFTPSLGCVAWGDGLYLADTHGAIVQVEPATGHVMRTWALPGPASGGIAWDAHTASLIALGARQVYQLAPATGRISSFTLPTPATALGQPYESIAVRGDGSIAVADLGSRAVHIYSPTGELRLTLPSAPTTFTQPTTLASDSAGSLYIADTDARAVLRLDAHNHLGGLFRAADDDEKE